MRLLKLLSVLTLAGCSALTTFSPKPVVPETRPIQFLPGSSFDQTVSNGLDNLDRRSYYNTDYGIQYLPTNVLLSLKRATNDSVPTVMDEMFFARPERFGLLPNYTDPSNPLPIGITRSTDNTYVAMSGINCAACHTSMISNDKRQFFLVDGGSSRFQIDVFIGEMLKSVVATLINPVEFEAFYERYKINAGLISLQNDTTDLKPVSDVVRQSYVSKDTSSIEKHPALKLASTKVKTTLTSGAYPTEEQLSTRAGMYAYLAHRFAYLFSFAKYGTNPAGSDVATSGPGRSNPWMPTKMMLADKYLHTKSTYKVVGGPINTPFMWDYNRQHWIFLLGNTNSMLERNMAQGVALLSDFNPDTLETTISIKKLTSISKYSGMAHAPSWPESILGPISRDKAGRGKQLFMSQCFYCHNPQQTSTEIASADFNYINAGTDNNYFNGQIETIDGKELFRDILTPFMTRVKQTAAHNENINLLTPYENGRTPVVWKRPNQNAIIAKPLAGVWATPPYLHNGSVPTIRDLLNPSYMRPSHFLIGGFVYNPTDLGFYEDPSAANAFNFDTHLVGNSNVGHEYGTNLDGEDKDAIIEFLKSYDASTNFYDW